MADNDGALPAANGGRDNGIKTIGDFLARSGAAQSTLDSLGRQLRTMEKWVSERHGEPTTLLQASLRDLEDVKKKLRERPSGPHYAAILRMLYSAAGRQDLAAVMKLKQRNRRLSPTEILTLGDVNRIIAAASSIRDRAIVAILWESGVRAHELCAVDLEDIRMKETAGRTEYSIFFKKVKISGEEHEGHVIEAADHMSAWLRIRTSEGAGQSSPLFTAWGGARLGARQLERIIKTTGHRAIPGKRIFAHLFRHSRATHLLRLGMSEPMVKKMLGWSPGSTMLSRYSHLVTRDARLAYLKVLGIQDGDAEEQIGHLVPAEGELKPVVPMVRPPGPKLISPEEVAARIDSKIADVERKMGMLLDFFSKRNPELAAALEDEKGTSP